MVAGKVKAAMGFQKSPATPNHTGSPSAQKAPPKTVFSRSFGVYFPRSSQVQPRPPDVIELVRLVEELQERESRLQTELLQYKIYKESVSIVPILEREISSKHAEVEASLQKIECLEAKNESLRQEVESLKKKITKQENEICGKSQGHGQDETAENESLRQEVQTLKLQMSMTDNETGKKMKEMENEIEELKRAVEEVNGGDSKVETGEDERRSPSQRFQPNLPNETKESSKQLEISIQERQSQCVTSPKRKSENHKQGSKNPKSADTDDERNNQIPVNEEVSELPVFSSGARGPRVPKPPPRPSSAPSSLTSSPEAIAVTNIRICPEKTKLPALPSFPPPPPPPALSGKGMPPPPPPPLPPTRLMTSAAAKVRRVPEVVEFYHSLMRRDSKRDSCGSVPDAPSAANTRNMIGEIENRSAHLIAIKTDVETQGDFIRFLIKEVKGAAFTDIEDVVAFVKWLDDELSFLVDERAVLKHFDWPEQKADAMREAAFGYCDLKKLESEACTLSDDPRQAWGPALKKMRASLEKLEHGIYSISRIRESASKRYKEFQIPTQWMLESGIVSQIKLASVKLAMKYMKRVSAELETVSTGPEEEELMVQGVRFAFRVHQFAGGFDVETMRAFEELRNKTRACQMKCQNKFQQQKLCCSWIPAA
ncbi:protein INCREASED PETAL GROWTH ANISOTROPY 1-like [Aristolochia californica]|uniref:protein INCREASED PETAL GROWTH ANISOTROPY 1-like n=1 Tax=Aristolochia californica TaxID=171875 RepID=UPI0035E27BA2